MTKESIDMAYEEFLQSVKNSVEERLGDGFTVDLHRVMKNNSVELDGLFIREGDNQILPSIYLNDYYNEYCNGWEYSDIISSVISVYNDSKGMDKIKGIPLQLYSEMKAQIVFRVTSFSRNEKLLENHPYIHLRDLAITFHCIINIGSSGIGSIHITNEHMRMWEIDMEELIRVSLGNTERLFPPCVRRIEEVIETMLENVSEPEREMTEEFRKQRENMSSPGFMYVLTNKQGINGAGCILYKGLLSRIFSESGKDFYILPSSIHEVILVAREEDTKSDRLAEMVREINRTQVSEPEVLADEVYLYSDIAEELDEFVRLHE